MPSPPSVRRCVRGEAGASISLDVVDASARAPRRCPAGRNPMKKWVLVLCVAMFALMTALLPGCTIRLGTGDVGASGDTLGEMTGGSSGDRLPEPNVGRIDPPVLDADQQ